MEQQQLSWAGPLAGTAEAGLADVGTVAPPELGPPQPGAGASNIRWLQAALNRVGNARLAEDGVAGRATREALRAFQATHGLPADGVAGPRTMAALRPGAIVLMHVGAHPQDGSTLDADALPGLIDRLRSAGYGFVTLDALLSP